MLRSCCTRRDARCYRQGKRRKSLACRTSSSRVRDESLKCLILKSLLPVPVGKKLPHLVASQPRATALSVSDKLNSYYDVSLKKARLCAAPAATLISLRAHRSHGSGGNVEVVREGAVRARRASCGQAGVRYLSWPRTPTSDSNVTGTLNVLEGCRHNSVEHLVYASTSSVYGANTDMPFSVHRIADHPVSLYAATKRATELMAHNYSWIFGCRRPGRDSLRCTGSVGTAGYGPLPVHSEHPRRKADRRLQLATTSADFTYVEDIAEGVVRSTERIAQPDPVSESSQPDPASSCAPFRVYNIGKMGGVQPTRYIEVIEECLGRKAQKNLPPTSPQMCPRRTRTSTIWYATWSDCPATPIEVGVGAICRLVLRILWI